MNEIGHILASVPEQKANYDNVVKSLLANRQFLARILNRFIPEFTSCQLNDIEKYFIEPESVSFYPAQESSGRSRIDGLSNEDPIPGLKAVQYDILFRAGFPDSVYAPSAASSGAAPASEQPRIGICINLEIQSNYYPGYPLEMRGFYYAARRLAAQLRRGCPDSDYGNLQKIYSIWLCPGNVPDKEANTATFYHTRKEDLIGSINKAPNIYDLMNVILLRINDSAAIEDATLRILQIVCSRQIPGRQKLPLLRSMGIRIDEEIREGIEHMCNLSDWIESEAKKEGHLAGLEEGRLTGLQEGRLTGLEEGKILIINQLIRSGLLEESQVLPLLKMSSQEFQEKTKKFSPLS